jgi:hypothetical protein
VSGLVAGLSDPAEIVAELTVPLKLYSVRTKAFHICACSSAS